jgi:hypothetical protein
LPLRKRPVYQECNQFVLSLPPVIQPNPNLRSCHHCRGTVSKDAHSCPHCGAPFYQVKKPAKQYGCGTLIVVLGLIAVVWAMVASKLNKWKSPPESPEAAEARRLESAAKWDGDQAWLRGREICKQHLKAPKTADFSTLHWSRDTGWELFGTNTWKVWGYVDAQNSFGANLRQNWRAVVYKNGSTHDITYLLIGDQEFGDRDSWLTQGEAEKRSKVVGSTNY